MIALYISFLDQLGECFRTYTLVWARNFEQLKHKTQTKSSDPYSIWKPLDNPLVEPMEIVLLIVLQKVKCRMTQSSNLIPEVQVTILLTIGSGGNYSDGIVRLCIIIGSHYRN